MQASDECLCLSTLVDRFRVDLTYLEQQGRFGNQLFQISAAFAYAADIARKHAAEHSDADSIVNSDDLSCLVCLPDTWRYRKFFPFIDSTLKDIRSVSQCDPGIRQYTLEEPSFSYRPWVCLPKITSPTIVHLSGYFQSDKYFTRAKRVSYRTTTDAQDTIGNLSDFLRSTVFRLRSDVLESCHRFMTVDRSVEISRSCSVHVRRGDYVQSQNVWPLCTTDYYIAALARVHTRVSDLRDVCVFSDDPEYIGEEWIPQMIQTYPSLNFHNMSERNVVRQSVISNVADLDRFEELFDMCCMSLCRAHVIANSTFSWWGSYLSECSADEAVVVAPIKWFGPDAGWINRNTQDVYRQHMIRV